MQRRLHRDADRPGELRLLRQRLPTDSQLHGRPMRVPHRPNHLQQPMPKHPNRPHKLRQLQHHMQRRDTGLHRRAVRLHEHELPVRTSLHRRTMHRLPGDVRVEGVCVRHVDVLRSKRVVRRIQPRMHEDEQLRLVHGDANVQRRPVGRLQCADAGTGVVQQRG